jgi:hypothetical protein
MAHTCSKFVFYTIQLSKYLEIERICSEISHHYFAEALHSNLSTAKKIKIKNEKTSY